MAVIIGTLGIVHDEDTENGRILLGQRSGRSKFGPSLYSGPGGKFEEGVDTSLLDCLNREIWEEFRIRIDRTRTEKIATILFWVAGLPHFLVHIYRVPAFSGTPMQTREMRPQWFERDALPFDQMFDGDPAFFKKLVRGERFCAHIFQREPGKGFERIEFLPFEPSWDGRV